MAANKNEPGTGPHKGSANKASWVRPEIRKLRAGAAELAVGAQADNVDRRS